MLQLSESNYGIIATELVRPIVNYTLPIEFIPKQIILCKRVSFDPFKDIIYIPNYNTESMPHLWWSLSELTFIHEQVKQEIIIIMNNSLTNINVKCAMDILCKYND